MGYCMYMCMENMCIACTSLCVYIGVSPCFVCFLITVYSRRCEKCIEALLRKMTILKDGLSAMGKKNYSLSRGF